jgi:hypothetical protein
VRPEQVEGSKVPPLGKEVKIVVGQYGAQGIRVMGQGDPATLILHSLLVREGFRAVRVNRFIQAGRMDAGHADVRPRWHLRLDGDACSLRGQNPDRQCGNSVSLDPVRTQNGKRVPMFGPNQPLDIIRREVSVGRHAIPKKQAPDVDACSHQTPDR